MNHYEHYLDQLSNRTTHTKRMNAHTNPDYAETERENGLVES